MAGIEHQRLPLHGLLLSLEAVGLGPYGPDQLLRVERLIRSLDWSIHADFPDEESLSDYFLPLLVQNAEQIDAFHLVFHRWYQRIKPVNLPEDITPPKSGEEKSEKPAPVWPWLAALAALVACLVLFWSSRSPNSTNSPPYTSFQVAGCLKVQEPDTFHNVTPALLAGDSLRFRWDFGDGSLDSSEVHPVHAYERPGYYEASLTVWNLQGIDSTMKRELFVSEVSRKIPASFTFSTDLVTVGKPIRLMADSIVEGVKYSWAVNEDFLAEGSAATFTPEKATSYQIRLRIEHPADSQGFCNSSQTRPLEVEVREKAGRPLEVEARAGIISPIPLDETLIWYPARFRWRQPRSWLFLLFLSFVPVGTWLLYRWIRRTPRPTEAFQQQFRPSANPPLRMPWPDQGSLLNMGPDYRELSRLMRRRENSEREELDLGATIHASLQEQGFPRLRYRSLTKEVSYLALVDQRNDRDHQAALFLELLERLREDDVPIDMFIFQGDPRYLRQPGSDREYRPEDLLDRFADRRLLVFGRTEHMMNNWGNKLHEPYLHPLLRWTRRVWVTATPVADWSTSELELGRHFVLLPGQLESQQLLAKDLLAEELPEFQVWRQQWALLEQEDSLFEYDWSDPEALREYLGSDLYRWMAATAIYLYPTWSLTLAVGAALSKQAGKGRGEWMQYQALLRLSRIPWLQDGSISEGLRHDLLAEMSHEDEMAARKAILEVLESIDMPDQALASAERNRQIIINHAITEPDNAEAQRQLLYLDQKQQLDSLSRSYVKEKNSYTLPWYLLWGLLFALMIGGGTLWSSWMSSREISQALSLSEPVTDSAFQFTLKGIEWHERQDLDSAIFYYQAALAVDSSYQNAGFNMELAIYQQANRFVLKGNFAAALDLYVRESGFETLQAAYLNGLVLCYWELGKQEEAQIIAGRLLLNHANWVEQYQPAIRVFSLPAGTFTMISLPAGTFTMGDVMGDGENDRELPLHDVTLRSFEMAATELSFAEYDLFCEATNREQPEDQGWGRGDRPVINVDWYDAVEYCNWLSEQMSYQPVYTISGQDITADWSANGFRLPTEAEWEYAARQAGQQVRFGNGLDTARTEEINFDGSADYQKPYSEVGEYRRATLPVRSLRSNSLGLYHMSGNVREWCWDWYGSYSDAAQRNPYGPQSGDYRVLRGGSWLSYPVRCRAADRSYYSPGFRNSYIGFRLTRTP